MRASDAERDQVVDELRDRFAEGRLTQDTFVRRVDAACERFGAVSVVLAERPAATRMVVSGS